MRNVNLTIHVEQMSDEDFKVVIEGVRTARSLVALTSHAIQELMNGTGHSFEEVAATIRKVIENPQQASFN